MRQEDHQTLLEKLREIEEQARLVLDEMLVVPSVHRTRLLHIVTLSQQLQVRFDENPN